jgi:glycosyltransferase involved in cell wall biosynthesis
MKIVQVTRHYATMGGIETFVAQSSRLLVRLGHDPVVVTGDELPGRGSTDGDYPVRYVPSLGTTREGAGVEAVADILREERPDVIVLHHIGSPGLTQAASTHAPTAEFVHGYFCAGAKLFRRSGALCQHRVGARCLVDWYAKPCGNSRHPGEDLKNLDRSLRHRKALRSADRIFVPSAFVREYLVGEGLHRGSIDVVNLAGGLPEPQPPEPREPREPRETKMILVAGRLTFSKGVGDAIAALALLPAQFELVIAGEGWYRPQLEAEVDRLGVTERVQFAGRLAPRDLVRQYAQANAVVVPSLWPEPGGTVVAEARRYGAQVVVYDSGGIPEWQVLGGVEVVERGNVAALAAAVERVSARPPEMVTSVVWKAADASFLSALDGLLRRRER